MSHIIIGSGFGGLSAAIYLAQAGEKVTVVEKNNQLGGRARVLEDQGFRRDMGPSRYLMPDLFARVFADWGIDINTSLDLHRLDPSYRIYRPDSHDHTDIFPDLRKNETYIESIEPGSYKKLNKYLDEAKIRYDIALEELLRIPYEHITQLLPPQVLHKILRVHPFHRLRDEVKKVFKDHRLQQILEYTMVFLGMSPEQSPAMYSMMSHVDFGLGVWYPQGGIRAVIDLMISQARKLGVTFITEFDVDRIMIVDGVARGVIDRKNHTIQADIIISNADLPYTETHMLPDSYQTYPLSYRQKKTIAPSTFLLYLGIEGEVKGLQHHTLIFRDAWDSAFTQIDTGQVPSEPSIYICCPSLSDPHVAPEGCTNLFVLVPLPAGIHMTSTQEEEFRNQVLDLIEHTLKQHIRSKIIVEHCYHNIHFKRDYHSYLGTAFGLGHTLRQSAYRRPHMQSQKVSNLYYVGGRTQPGIGMPMCMMSGKLVSEKILNKH